MNSLFKIGILIIAGSLGGRLAKRLRFPDVTGYLVAGLLIGPSLLKLLNPQDIESFSVISEFALAAIAFSIGSEFELKTILKIGKDILIIALAEVVGAILLVFLVTYFVFGQSFIFSIILATTAAATAPAATIMVIRQYRAHGPLTGTILPVVALDDALGIMIFGISISIAKLITGSASVSFLQIIGAPSIEVIGSLVLGLLLGSILTYIANRAKSREGLLSMILASITIGSGLASYLTFSPLLTCMMLGATVVNLSEKSNRVFSVINDFTTPVYLLFFALAGAGLDLRAFFGVGALGIGYVLARAGGKILGAYTGARISDADTVVTKYLGLSLIPQGGVSIGLTMLIRKELPQFSGTITTIVLFSVLVYEILGPILTQIAIHKAGEVGGLDKLDKLDKQKPDSDIVLTSTENLG
ncbi:MAG: cation:proton antiporter [Candidatus Alkaliphilus sp. MAG34]